MSETAYRRWICDACGYIYDEAKGDPDSGLAPGTRFEAIPEDWQCPLCGLTKTDLRPLPEGKTSRGRPLAQRNNGVAFLHESHDDLAVPRHKRHIVGDTVHHDPAHRGQPGP